MRCGMFLLHACHFELSDVRVFERDDCGLLLFLLLLSLRFLFSETELMLGVLHDCFGHCLREDGLVLLGQDRVQNRNNLLSKPLTCGHTQTTQQKHTDQIEQ